MFRFSFLFRKTVTARQAVLKSWFHIALGGMVLAAAGMGVELITLETTFAIILSLQYAEGIVARSIRKSISIINAIDMMARIEGREIQRRIAAFDYVASINVRCRSSESRQASFVSLGLPHPSLTARLLPLPVSIARQ